MSAFRELEHSGWNSAADEYDGAFARLTTQSIPALLEAVGAGPGVRLLDVACGPGYVAAEAARRGAKVTGLDFSASMLRIARARNPGITFVEGDAQALDFPDASFDAVTMNFGALHLDDPDLAIREAGRVLAPGGRFGFTVWAPPEQTAAFRIVLGAVARCGRADVALPPGPPFFQFSDPMRALDALKQAGLVQVRTRIIDQTWRFGAAGELFDCMMSGTVRTAALLKAQTAAEREAIRAAIEQDIAGFAVAGGGYALPMPSVLSSARKPG
jgi:SAM-dependent methyltransferase